MTTAVKQSAVVSEFVIVKGNPSSGTTDVRDSAPSKEVSVAENVIRASVASTQEGTVSLPVVTKDPAIQAEAASAKVVVSAKALVPVKEEEHKKDEAISAGQQHEPSAVSSKEQRLKEYVTSKRELILKKYNDWKKDLDPQPSVLLSLVPGMKQRAKDDAAKMMATFESKLAEASTVKGIKEVLTRFIGSMEKRRSLVNEATEKKLQEGIQLIQDELTAMSPKK
jgi:hypothetical protein